MKNTRLIKVALALTFWAVGFKAQASTDLQVYECTFTATALAKDRHGVLTYQSIGHGFDIAGRMGLGKPMTQVGNSESYYAEVDLSKDNSLLIRVEAVGREVRVSASIQRFSEGEIQIIASGKTRSRSTIIDRYNRLITAVLIQNPNTALAQENGDIHGLIRSDRFPVGELIFDSAEVSCSAAANISQ